jgi:hypothetical protein
MESVERGLDCSLQLSQINGGAGCRAGKGQSARQLCTHASTAAAGMQLRAAVHPQVQQEAGTKASTPHNPRAWPRTLAAPAASATRRRCWSSRALVLPTAAASFRVRPCTSANAAASGPCKARSKGRRAGGCGHECEGVEGCCLDCWRLSGCQVLQHLPATVLLPPPLSAGCFKPPR